MSRDSLQMHTAVARRVVRALVLGLAVVIFAACSDDEASGPGTVTVVVSAGVPLGAAVVELSGAPVDGVDEIGGGWTALAPLPPAADGTPRYRLVVISDQPGELRAPIRVPDVAGRLPAVTVIDATDQVDSRPPSLGATARVVR